MNLSLNEAQEMLRSSAREFLSETSSPLVVRDVEATGRGYSRDLWQSMAGLGWLGLGLPESAGGMAGDMTDIALFAEELGRVVAPAPWISTVVWAGSLLANDSSDTAQELVQRIIRGEITVAVANREADLGYGPDTITLKAEQDGDSFRLSGEKRFVMDGAEADYFITVGRVGSGTGEEGITLFVVESGAEGLRVIPQPTTDGDTQAVVQYDNVRPVAVLGEVGQGWALLEEPTRKATIALTAWMLGGAETAADMSVAYAKMRVQFGRAIGSFQAISHKLADVRWRLDAIRMLVVKAVSTFDDADNDADVSAAKAYGNQWIGWVMHRCHEVFAGAGFMKIHDLQLYFRRLLVAASWLGDEQYHRRNVVNRRIRNAA